MRVQFVLGQHDLSRTETLSLASVQAQRGQRSKGPLTVGSVLMAFFARSSSRGKAKVRDMRAKDVVLSSVTELNIGDVTDVKIQILN